MDVTIHFPDKMGKEISLLPNVNKFIIEATQKALLEKWRDTETDEAIKRADAGKYADDKDVDSFFSKWAKDEN
jgi:hypothetical protein